MRILYLTHAHLDYLADEVLYGLRQQFGSDIVDYPKKEILYQTSRDKVPNSMVWANGATAFGLADLAVDRDDISRKIEGGYFDYIINSNCWRIHSPIYKNLVTLDGQDHHYINPIYLGRVLAYFKRELLWQVNNVQPIQFALPDHLYDTRTVPKTQLTHASFAVYPGLRHDIAAAFTTRLFDDWHEYILDIKRSWFGISPKGAGYDCQRHYEILGNAVLCIYLDTAAPRVLREQFVDGANCLVFTSVDELKRKIAACIDRERLLENGRQALLRFHLASCRARQLIGKIAELSGRKRHYHLLSSIRYGYLPYYSMRIGEYARSKVLRAPR